MDILYIFHELWRGKDLYRIFMNEECRRYNLRGKVLDIGSGLKRASYYRFLRREHDCMVECLDLEFNESEGGMQIDLEQDVLPHASTSIDTILLFNVLEHLYNFSLVLSEIKRVLKSEGKLLGVVPFLVAYHPDPHDYWRYTKEALEKNFLAKGFVHIQITPFGYGPCTAAFSQMEAILPRIVKILSIPCVLLCDTIIIKVRPKMDRNKFSLGLFFNVSK